MTDQQAIKVLKKRLAKCHPCDDIAAALELAINAIEKQLVQKVQGECATECAEERKLVMKPDGIYLNGVNLTGWMQYAAEGGKQSLSEYVKQHTTRPTQNA